MINEGVFKIYNKCCENYQKVDDLRAKQLGFLPLASDIILFVTFIAEKEREV